MTEPTDFELLELATPYALHAMSDEERANVDRRVAAAPSPVAAALVACDLSHAWPPEVRPMWIS